MPAHFTNGLFKQLSSLWCREYWTIKLVEKYLVGKSFVGQKFCSAKTFVRWTLHLAWKGKFWLEQNLSKTKNIQGVCSLFYIAALGWLSRNKINNINWISGKLINFKTMYLCSTVVKKERWVYTSHERK